MTQQDRTEKALELLRDLPVEISVEDVGHMVTLFPLIQPTTSWFGHINLNSILMTTAGTMIIAGAAYFFMGVGDQQATMAEQPAAEISAPAAQPATALPIEIPASDPVPSATLLSSSGDDRLVSPPVASPQEPPVIVAPPSQPEEPLAAVAPAPVRISAPAPVAPSFPAPQETTMDPEAYLEEEFPGKNIARKDYDLKGFTSVKVYGPLEVYIAQGPFSVSADGNAEELESIVVNVNGKVLEIRGGGNSKGSGKNCKDKGEDDRGVRVILPDLQGVQLYGSGDVNIEDFKNMATMELELKGSGDIHFASLMGLEKLAIALAGSGDIHGEEVTVSGPMVIALAGSGDIIVGGRADKVEISVVGSGDVDAERLTANTAKVTITGSGDVSINCKGTLTKTVMGSGDIYDAGSSGSGSRID